MSEQSVFLAALEIDDPDARAAYLDRACGHDPDARRRLDELFAAQARAADGGFLGRPAVDQWTPTPTVAASPGRTPDPPGPPAGIVLAGRYVLGVEIGSGGMGTVYRAEQVEPVRRAVAVKLVRPGMDSKGLLARFEAERQALARMDHPHIATVFDAGTAPDGRPFFVMELVHGVPLTDYCDSRGLDLADRLRVFQRVCGAVQHAHQKGVIHRDLKPTNILVEERDGKPVPKAIDFGLAKAVDGATLVDQPALTAPGAFVGTPVYMAPEQAGPGGADIDTRADIYALGAILYELLTGTTPIGREALRQAPLYDLLRMIREDDPPPPSRRLREMRNAEWGMRNQDRNRSSVPPPAIRVPYFKELDWVVMKALDKAPDRRYESAAALAADVGRFLAHEPVAAAPPATGYRVRKFVRRNRAAVAAAGVVLLALVSGVAGTTWGLVEARRGQAKAEQASDRAARALDALTDDALEGLLGRQAVWSDRERAFLDKVGDQLGQLAAAEGETEAVRRVRGVARLRLGSVRALLGDAAAAEADYRAAADEFDRLGDPASRGNAAAARRRLGGLLSSTGRPAEAQAEFARAVEVLDRLAGEHPGEAAYRFEAALVRNDAGFTHVEAGEFGLAEPLLRAAVAGLGELLTADPAHPDSDPEKARALHNLFTVLRRTGRAAEGERALGEAIELLRAAAAARRDPRVALALGKALRSRAAVLTGRGDGAGAEAAQREAVDLHAALAADYGAVPDYRHELARGQLNLGLMYGRLGRPADAVAALRAAEATARRLADDFRGVPEYRRLLANARLALGEEFGAGGRDNEAEAVLAEALPLWERLHADAPGSPAHLAGLVATLFRLGTVAEARKDDRRAMDYLERADRHRAAAPGLLARDPTGAAVEPELVVHLADTRTKVRLGLGDHAGAAARADELAGVAGRHAAVGAFNAGCYLSRCVGLAGKDPGLPPDRRRDLVEDYGRRAVAHLRTALARGYDRPAFATDADLIPLWDRADFRALLAGRE